MVHYGLRLVLAEGADEADVAAYAAGFGWPRVAPPADPPPAADEVVWDMEGAGRLHFLTDENTGRAYLYVVTETRNLADAFSADLAQRIPVVPRSDLLAGWDRAREPDRRRDAILLLALGGPHAVDEDVVERIRRALADPDANVRLAGVQAVLYTPLRTYRPALRQVAASDPDPRVSAEAADVLSVFDAIGVPNA